MTFSIDLLLAGNPVSLDGVRHSSVGNVCPAERSGWPLDDPTGPLVTRAQAFTSTSYGEKPIGR